MTRVIANVVSGAGRWRAACGWLLGAGLLAGCGPEGLPNVLLITLDTTRADRLSCYGHARETSPHLDRLARESLRYEHAYAVSSWTLPSHASLFTGKFPTSHGAAYDPEGPLILSQGIKGPAGWDRFRARSLAVDERTLAGRLGAHGYDTAAVVAGPWLRRVFGLDRGFEHYDDSEITSVNGRSADRVTQAAIEWLDEGRDADRPFFLFLNYFDPHGPYNPPRGHRRTFMEVGQSDVNLTREQKRDLLYDAEIHFMDAELGRLLDNMRRKDLFDDTWIIVTADHGELMGEGGAWGHGETLSEAELRIPLLVKAAGGGRVGVETRPVQLPDVFSLIAEATNLAGAAEGVIDPEAGHPIVAEVGPVGRPAWRALIGDRWKFVSSSEGARHLFDLQDDPWEQVDRIDTESETGAQLENRMDDFFAALPRPGPASPATEVDPEEIERLRSLGYLD